MYIKYELKIKNMTESTQITTGTGTLEGFEHLYDTQEQTEEQKELNDLINQYSNFDELIINNVYTGVIESIGKKYCTVDINGKSSIYVNINNGLESGIIQNFTEGDEIDVMITSIDHSSFTVYGSIYNVVLKTVFSTVEEYVQDRSILKGYVLDMNHAGYTVKTVINDTEINLFMPHLLTDVNKLPDAESIIDTEIYFMIDTIEKDGNIQYIASRKKYLKSLIKEKIKNLNKGEVYTGTVTGPTSFGIFLQFEECLTAMIHKSNLSEDAVKMLEANDVKPGMVIEFFVKDIGKNNKIFGTQIDESSLWDNVNVGDKMKGAVSSVKDFGVLVSLDYETKGLIHKSNLPKDVSSYKRGEMLYVQVTNVNKSNRQITLNLA